MSLVVILNSTKSFHYIDELSGYGSKSISSIHLSMRLVIADGLC